MQLYVFVDELPEKCVKCDFVSYDTKKEVSICGLSGKQMNDTEKRDNSCELRKATKAIKKQYKNRNCFKDKQSRNK